MRSTIKIPLWILVILGIIFLSFLWKTYNVKERLTNSGIAISEPKKSTLKTFYATDSEVRKIYNDLLDAGFTSDNYGTFTQFNQNLQSWVQADIIWQTLVQKGYRNYGTKNEFVRKYAKNPPAKYMD